METKQKKKKRVWIWIVLAIIAVFIAGRFLMPTQYSGTTETVTKGDISTYYSFSGSVEAENRATVYAYQAYQIRDFKVEEGDIVEEDDDLYKTNYSTYIESPIDGEVLEIYVSEDEQLVAGDIVMEIVDYSSLKINIKVDEYDLSAIKKGMDAEVTIHAIDKTVIGKITDISKEGVYANGVTYFTATITIDPKKAIKVGMSAEATVLKDSAEGVLLLPMSAIQYDDDNQAFVYILSDNELTTKTVTLGITNGTIVEIKDGLTENEEIFVPTVEMDYYAMRQDQ